MKFFDYIHDHAQDIEFYTVNGAVFMGSLFTPLLSQVKEALGIVVLISVIIYNFYRIKNERKRLSDKEKPNQP